MHSLKKSLFTTYTLVRGLHFLVQLRTLEWYTRTFTSHGLGALAVPVETKNKVRESVIGILKSDAENAARGLYPASLLFPENVRGYLERFPQTIIDSINVHLRRERGETRAFSGAVNLEAIEAPIYFKRNYHFQTDGYLSQKSAEVYDHQVEILFAGTAAAMRRMVLVPLVQHNAQHPLKNILEVAAGTGAMSRMLTQTFKDAHVIVSDVSQPYLDFAAARMKRERVSETATFECLNATHLPQADASQDAWVCVYLFHELPVTERKRVLDEAYRVLRPGGMLTILDSIQLADIPEFDPFLEDFPKHYHEPFFADYVKTGLEGMVEAAGFRVTESRPGFLSKLVAAVK